MRDPYDKYQEFWAFHFLQLSIMVFRESLFDWFLVGALKDEYDR